MDSAHPSPAGRPGRGPRIRFAAPGTPELDPVVAPEAVQFVARLVRAFGARRDRLLEYRADFADQVRRGRPMEPPAEGRAIREAAWSVPPPGPGLETRTVEIVGSPEARTAVRALNSKADVFVADFEDLHPDRWAATVAGQLTLARAVRRSLGYTSSTGEHFRVVPKPATLMVRPRAWHRLEPNLTVDGRPVPAALVDAGLYLYHNAHELLRTGTGPYFVLPKLEHYAEAALWDDVFRLGEKLLDLPPGSIRATVVIETVPAALEIEEILFALRSHGAGLAFGRNGYTFSFLKQFRDDRTFVPPDRGALGPDAPFLLACSRRVIAASHRRGTVAINATPVYLVELEVGGPSRPEVGRELAVKVRDAHDGYDGTWVGHPGAVPTVREFFTMRSPIAPDAQEPSGELEPQFWTLPNGPVSEEGTREAVRTLLRYLEARGQGAGSVTVDHSVEDASTAEVARALLWCRVHGVGREGGLPGAPLAHLRQVLDDERDSRINEVAGDVRRSAGVEEAARLVGRLARSRVFPAFLSLVPPGSGPDGVEGWGTA